MELADKVSLLRSALRELLRLGEHDGPCANEDDPYDSCELHVAAAGERKQHALEVLEQTR